MKRKGYTHNFGEIRVKKKLITVARLEVPSIDRSGHSVVIVHRTDPRTQNDDRKKNVPMKVVG
jgi:hypothetical protein